MPCLQDRQITGQNESTDVELKEERRVIYLQITMAKKFNNYIYIYIVHHWIDHSLMHV